MIPLKHTLFILMVTMLSSCKYCSCENLLDVSHKMCDEQNYDEAIKCLDKYLIANPYDVEALDKRSDTYRIVKDYKRALSDINDAIKYYKENDDYMLSWLYMTRDDIYIDWAKDKQSK